MKKPIITGLFAILANCALAATHTVDGIEWTYTVSNGEASLGGGSWDAPAISKTTTGAIIIPSTLDGLPVTSIGERAFSGCQSLTSVSIPDSVTSMGDNAFSGCNGLTRVTIPNSVTSIGISAFSSCHALTSVTIGNSVVSIGENAFNWCDSLTSVVIPNSVISIGGNAFGYCGLTNITIGVSVTNIGEKAFYFCSGLTSVAIPDSVTSIGGEAFSGCRGLTSVTIPDSVQSIEAGAFNGCSGLTSVTIPDFVTSIGNSAFYGCSGLTSVTIPDSVQSIEAGAFYGCSGLTSVSIPNGVTSIGDAAFWECDNIREATVPGWSCNIPFYNVTNLVISEGTTSIEEDAFYDCSELMSVTISDSVTSIGDNAFCDCSGLTSVKIGQSVESIGESAFDSCSELTSVTIPDSVTSIGDSAFYNCDSLETASLPGKLKGVVDEASIFPEEVNVEYRSNGSSDTTYTWSDTTYTWQYELNGTEATITGVSPATGDISIPATIVGNGTKYAVTSIEEYAFNSSELTSVVIPDSVTSIGERVFSWCGSLTNIEVSEENPNYSSKNGFLLSKDGKTLLEGVNGYVVIPDSVTDIVNCAFEGRTLTNIQVEEGNACYSSENGLLLSKNRQTLIRGVNVNVVIPDSVTSIGDYAFKECWGLTSVTIGNGVTSIGESAFDGCRGLTSVTIPDSVTTIGDWAFCDCSGLTSVTFLGDDPNIGGQYTFSGVAQSCVVYVSRNAKFNIDSDGRWCGMKVEFYDLEDEPVEPDPITPDPVDPDPVQPDPVTPDPVTPDPVTPAPVNPQPGPAKPSYEVIEAEDIVAAYEVPKAVVLKGVIYGGDEVVGIIELKLGKVNAKKGSGKVSGSVTTLDGKKHTIKAVNVTGIDGKSAEAVSLEVKDMGTMNIRIGGAEFAGDMAGGYHVQSGEVGGEWRGRGATVTVEADSVSMFAGAVLEELLPVPEQATVSGGKWKFEKATGVKWAKPKKGAARPELYDEASGKGLMVDESGGKTNHSAMKLTYTPKKGTFKGSFKVYALEGEGKATKLKKYKVSVSGLVVGGVGHGTATCKQPSAKWTVTVK